MFTTAGEAVGAGLLSRTLEAGMESAGAYDAAIAKGLTSEEANEVANKVFTENFKLAGVDIIQAAAIFAPVKPLGKVL